MKKIMILSLMFLTILTVSCFAIVQPLDVEVTRDFDGTSYTLEEPTHKLTHFNCPTECDLTIRANNQIIGRLKLRDSVLTIDSETTKPLRITGYSDYKEWEQKIQVINGQNISLSKHVYINLHPEDIIHADRSAYAEGIMARFNRKLPEKRLDRDYFNSFRVGILEEVEKGYTADITICDQEFINLYAIIPKDKLTKKTRFDVEIKNEKCSIHGVISTKHTENEFTSIEFNENIEVLFSGENIVYQKDANDTYKIIDCEFIDCYNDNFIYLSTNENHFMFGGKDLYEEPLNKTLLIKTIKIEKALQEIDDKLIQKNKLTIIRTDKAQGKHFTKFGENILNIEISPDIKKLEMYEYEDLQNKTFLGVLIPYGKHQRMNREYYIKFNKTNQKNYYELLFSEDGNLVSIGDKLELLSAEIKSAEFHGVNLKNVNMFRNFKEKYYLITPATGQEVELKDSPIIYHKIKEGDNLIKISKEYFGSTLNTKDIISVNSPWEILHANNQLGARENNEEPVNVPGNFDWDAYSEEEQIKPIGMYIAIPLEIYEYVNPQTGNRLTEYPQGTKTLNERGRNIQIRTRASCANLGGECLYYENILNAGDSCGEGKIIYERLCPHNNHVRCCAPSDQETRQQNDRNTATINARTNQRVSNSVNVGNGCRVPQGEVRYLPKNNAIKDCQDNENMRTFSCDENRRLSTTVTPCQPGYICLGSSCERRCVSQSAFRITYQRRDIYTSYIKDTRTNRFVVTIPYCGLRGVVRYKNEYYDYCTGGSETRGAVCYDLSRVFPSLWELRLKNEKGISTRIATRQVRTMTTSPTWRR